MRAPRRSVRELFLALDKEDIKRMNLFTQVKNITLDILFPPLCLGCKNTLCDHSLLLCADCRGKIHLQNAFFCPECGARLPEMKKTCHPGAPLICGAAEIYGHEPATELVKLLKYSGIRSAAQILGNVLFEYANSLNIPLETFVVIPIPLPQKRLRTRGYNQAELTALGLLRNAKIETGLLRALERKYTKPQTEMKNYETRQKNIAGCFSLTDENLIAEKNIILIDDVYTSGSTLKEAARVLKAAGAKKILGLTILRAHA